MRDGQNGFRALASLSLVSMLLLSFSGVSFSENAGTPSISDAMTNIPELEDHTPFWNPVPEPRSPGIVYILVEPGLYSSIVTQIDRYLTDLTNEGWTPVLHTTGWSTIYEVKTLLQTGYGSGMQGAFFVGDIPIAWYEMDDVFDGTPYGWTEFPIDLFYMDLDGTWVDSDFNTVFDDHLDGTGDLEPEIWVGRLYASTISIVGETEVSLVQNYFDKNHDYRMGNLPLNDRALVYIDDDWAPWSFEYDNDVGQRYSTRTLVDDEETTIASDYLGRLDDNYDLIQLFAHSWEGGHGFYYNGHSQTSWLYNEEISGADPMAHFYNLFCCSAGNYSNDESEGYIAGHYVFAETYGLDVIASAKTGSMLNFADFYTPLGAGETLGQSYLDWFILNGETGAGVDSRCWFYGMTLLGDPTLDTFDDGPVILPSVTVTQPNTALTWAMGSSQEITWTAAAGDSPLEPNPITIYYSYDDPEGDGPWTLVADNELNDGSYSWNPVPFTPSTDCWVKIEAHDTDGKTGYDVSDVAFTIEAVSPTITLLGPNGGESLMGGGSWPITWSASAGGNPLLANPITIYYSSTGVAGPWNLIAGNEANDGTYDWNPVPLLDNSNCFVRIMVEDTGGFAEEDVSDSSFEIDSTAPAPATNPRAELDGTGVRIYWDASPSPDVDHYEVYWIMNAWDASGDSYSNYFDVGLNTDYQHANIGISNPSSYVYQVRAYDPAGNEARTIIQAAKYGSTQAYIASYPVHWYLIGYSLVMSDTSIAHVMQGLGLPEQINYLRGFDADAGVWTSYNPHAPNSISTISDIYVNEGHWLLIDNSHVRFTTAGYVEDKAITLFDGWNLVAYPFAERGMTTSDIISHLSANCPGYDEMAIADTVTASPPPYHIKTPDGTEMLTHNSAFWVHVSMDTTWTIINY